MQREIKSADLVEVTGRQTPYCLKKYYKKRGLVLSTTLKSYGLRVVNSARVYFDCGDVVDFFDGGRPYLSDLSVEVTNSESR